MNRQACRENKTENGIGSRYKRTDRNKKEEETENEVDSLKYGSMSRTTDSHFSRGESHVSEK
jgi:hypothetical protein